MKIGVAHRSQLASYLVSATSVATNLASDFTCLGEARDGRYFRYLIPGRATQDADERVANITFPPLVVGGASNLPNQGLSCYDWLTSRDRVSAFS